MKILVLNEDRALANFISKGLQQEGYRCETASDLAMAGERFTFNLVVLDVASPEHALSSLRKEEGGAPVLVLTSRSRVEDRVALLDLGAEDCVLKPFSFAELAARVRVVLRRGEKISTYQVRYGDLELNRVERTVHRAGKHIELTTKEFALLEYLLLNAGKAVSRAMILEDVWRLHFDTMTNVVDVYINYFEELSMKEIGAVLGVVESRISQIHSAAILKLRAQLQRRTQTRPSPVVERRTARFAGAAR
ncbi:MAG: winged helix-turn-helix domain-containing protein [Acidobacteriales bacterium]|nr:winged helix-turn-helix domain-containing protein [Terriglobales bacterium]